MSKTNNRRTGNDRQDGRNYQANFRDRTPKGDKDEVPVLKYGPDNNFQKFKEKLSRVALEKFGNMATFTETDQDYVVPAVDTSLYPNRATDEVEKALYLEECKLRVKEIARIKEDKPKLYAMILLKLSQESIDEVRRHKDYCKFNTDKDPVELWKAIKELHLVSTTSKVEGAIKASSRYNYANCGQSAYESIISYKERFDYALEAYDANGNPKMSDEDIAMDFLNGLDPARYDDFKVEVINDLAKKTLKAFTTVNEVYLLASRRVVKKTAATGTGVTFATADSVRPIKKPSKGLTDKSSADKKGKAEVPDEVTVKTPTKTSSDNKSTSESSKGPKTKVLEEDATCWICNKVGHFARNCKEDDDSSISTSSKTTGKTPKKKFGGMTLAFNTSRDESNDGGNRWETWEVLLDECSEVSVVHPSLLINIREAEGVGFRGLYQESQKDLNQVGDLKDFFTCQVCSDCSANILCGAMVEDLYPITYKQGVSKTIHMEDRDLVFHRRGCFYVADFRDWLSSEDEVTIATNNKASYAFVTEEMFTSKEIKRANEAGEFVTKAGYPSVDEAVRMVTDGNIQGHRFDSTDVKRYFALNGPLPASVKGKTTTPKQVPPPIPPDPELKEQITDQYLISDVMDLEGHKFLITLSLPLGLLLQSHLTSESKDSLGRALQSHLGVLRARGFNPTIVYVDPQRGLKALRLLFPGVEVDVSGASDKLPRVDIKMRRIKEVARSVKASLPWQLPKFLMKDLVAYSIARLNVRRTTTIASLECPRVRFTGRKINFKKEFDLQFGEYCELPIDKKNLSGPLALRTESAIALYPIANANNSWCFLSLTTKVRVERSNWVKMVTNDVVINRMNELAGVNSIPVTQDSIAPPANEFEDAVVADQQAIATHAPSTIELFEETSDYIGESNKLEPLLAEPDNTLVEPETPEISVVISGEGLELETGVQTRSGRTIKPRTLLNLFTKLKTAITNPKARRAIVNEFVQVFAETKALKPVKRSQLTNETFLRCLLILTEKFKADGAFDKIKARIVCDGRDQIYLEDAWSPTGKLDSIFVSLTCKKYRYVMVIDVKGAYLEATMDENVYMTFDPTLTAIILEIYPEMKEYVEYGRLSVQVMKALYGCKQSGKLWYLHLTNVLTELGFLFHPLDPCVMTRGSTVVTIYVDDMLLLSTDEEPLKEIEVYLKRKFQEIKCELTNEFSYLGMHITIREDKVIISMKKFIDDFLKLYGNLSTRNYVTPTTMKFCEIDMKAPLLGEKRKKIFHTIIAKLLYLSKRVRLDLLFSVTFLSTRVKSPTEDDWCKLVRIIGHLQATHTFYRVLRRQSNVPRLEHYVDAAFGVHSDGKSHTGSCIFWNDTCLSVSSTKQKMVAKDSTEAELIGLSDKLNDVLWMTEFLEGLGKK